MIILEAMMLQDALIKVLCDFYRLEIGRFVKLEVVPDRKNVGIFVVRLFAENISHFNLLRDALVNGELKQWRDLFFQWDGEKLIDILG